MMQLAFDFETKRDPFTCPHMIRTAYDIKNGEVLCGLNGEVYTNCHASVSGDPPKCAYEPLNNSQESIERRKAWMERR